MSVYVTERETVLMNSPLWMCSIVSPAFHIGLPGVSNPAPGELPSYRFFFFVFRKMSTGEPSYLPGWSSVGVPSRISLSRAGFDYHEHIFATISATRYLFRYLFMPLSPAGWIIVMVSSPAFQRRPLDSCSSSRTLLPGFWLEPENLSISHQSSGPYTGFQLHLGSILKYFYSFISRSMA